MEWQTILVTLLGNLTSGGLAVLVTLRWVARKAAAEAKGEAARAAQAEMDLSKMYVDEFKANIGEPLQREVKGLRRDVKQLRNAIQRINDCPHADGCPVRHELQRQQDAEPGGGA